MNDVDRLPPHSRAAERSFLGTMLRNKDAVLDASGLLKEEDFYLDCHQRIFRAMLALNDTGKPVDVVLLRSAIKDAGDMEDVGGEAYLGALLDAAPAAEDYRHYASIIKTEAAKRALITLSNDAIGRAYAPREPVDEMLADIEQQFLEVTQRMAVSDAKHVGEALNETFVEIDKRRARRDAFSGVPSGFLDLDVLTAGFKNGELAIIAARPSVGKTAIAVNVARHTAVSEKIPTLFVSLEQGRVELTERFLCCQGRIDSHRLKTGRVRPDEAERVFVAGEVLARSKLYIDDRNSQTLMQICANVRHLKRLKRIGIVFIDYLQLVMPDSKKENRQEQVATISRRFKLLARELKIPIIVLAQLNRETEKRGDGRPKLSDLRESGAIEQDADLVILLHRPVDERGHSEGIIEAIVAKHRNGPTGSAQLIYIRQHMTFENYASGTPQFPA